MKKLLPNLRIGLPLSILTFELKKKSKVRKKVKRKKVKTQEEYIY